MSLDELPQTEPPRQAGFSLTRLAVRRPLSTAIGVAGAVVLGCASLAQLPVSLLPSLGKLEVEIHVVAPDVSQQEFLQRITIPLEQQLRTAPGVDSVRTETTDGEGHFVIESSWQTDADRLRIDIERRLSDLSDEGVVGVSVDVAPGDTEATVEVAVLGGESGARRTEYTDTVLMPELARIPGAGRLETVGRSPSHVVAAPKPAALAARGLTWGRVIERIDQVGRSYPAGVVRDGALARSLVLRESIDSIDELGSLTVRSGNDTTVLRDVATFTLAEIRDEGHFKLNDQDGVLVRVRRAPDGNAIGLASEVRRTVEALSTRLPPGLTLRVVRDRSEEVLGAVRVLGIAALSGLVLGSVLLRWGIGSWRPTLSLAIVIPASIIASFSGFYFAGLSLDLVSLAGLALAAGLLVDNSIVVLEAIEVSRASSSDARILGTSQVAAAVIAATMTTAIVFLPLVYLRGLSRAFFGVQGAAIVVALVVSLVLSLTLTPVLAGRTRSRRTDMVHGLQAYGRVLRFCLGAPYLTIGAALVCVLAGALALAALPRELLPESKERELEVRYRLPPHLSTETEAEEGRSFFTEISRALEGFDIGLLEWVQGGITDGVSGSESGQIVVRPASAADLQDVWSALEGVVRTTPGASASVDVRSSAIVDAVQRAGSRVTVVATASNEEQVRLLAKRIAAELARRSGLRLMVRPGGGEEPVLSVRWNTAALSRLGLPIDAAEEQVRAAVRRGQYGALDIPGVAPQVVADTLGSKQLEYVPVGSFEERGMETVVYPLGALGRIEAGMRANRLERLDGRPVAFLPVDLGTGSLGSLRQILDGLDVEDGESVRLLGEAAELKRSFPQLLLVLGIAVLLVFLTIAAIFESFRTPLLIMMTIPMAVAGAAMLLWGCRQSLNIMSFMGVILLTGIVVNNSIVLLYRANQFLRQGSDRRAAVLDAARERFRPIILTTLTTLSGMLPMALLGGDGVELRRAMSLTVVGGLLTALAASLLLLPVLYLEFSGRRGLSLSK